MPAQNHPTAHREPTAHGGGVESGAAIAPGSRGRTGARRCRGHQQPPAPRRAAPADVPAPAAPVSSPNAERASPPGRRERLGQVVGAVDHPSCPCRHLISGGGLDEQRAPRCDFKAVVTDSRSRCCHALGLAGACEGQPERGGSGAGAYEDSRHPATAAEHIPRASNRGPETAKLFEKSRVPGDARRTLTPEDINLREVGSS
jgi:hypothetical protein